MQSQSPSLVLSQNPIGIFDSGVGGLSVLRVLRQQFPAEALLYLADQAHVPYGPRSLEDIRRFSEAITRFLLAQGAKLIVVACNTASAAALRHLRSVFPETPFVGMEPAVKPAAEGTHSGVVGVLATPATFQGALYASVIERFANGVQVLQDTCPGLVPQIEKGMVTSEETRRILEKALDPMLQAGVDTIVLGCTHYPFVIPLIEEITGPEVRVIDPAPAVVRQVGRLLQERQLSARRMPGEIESAPARFLTSGDPTLLQNLLPALLGSENPVEKLEWQDGELKLRGYSKTLPDCC
jgi:glutamate racemase